jgi:hypothetical protein
LTNLESKYQREKGLLEQSLEHQVKVKCDTINDLTNRINRLELINAQLNESKNNEKSKAEKNHYQAIRETETKSTQKISELTEQLRWEKNDKEVKINERDHQLKELKEKYEHDKIQK